MFNMPNAINVLSNIRRPDDVVDVGMQQRNRLNDLRKQKLQNQILSASADVAPDMQQAQLSQLTNRGKLLGEQADLYRPNVLSQIGLRSAQQEAQKQKAANPLSQQGLSGPAHDRQSLEMLKQVYGEDSKLYQDAKDDYEARKNQRLAETEYTRNLKGATSYKRAQREMNDQENKLNLMKEQGASPQEIAQQQMEVNRAQTNAENQISTPSLREEAVTFRGMSNMMDDVRPKIKELSRLTGPKGEVIQKLMKARNLLPGQADQLYNDLQLYKEKQVPLLVDQLRKSLSTSIRNEYLKENLYKVVDIFHNNINNNPEKAQQAFNYLDKYIKREYKSRLEEATGSRPLGKELKEFIDKNEPAQAAQSANQNLTREQKIARIKQLKGQEG